MSGHSKWHTIKHKKAAIDAKRGKIFTRLIKEILIAARNGGDPESNARLRTAIVAAKAVSMPADNIKRAIMRGTGELEGSTIEEVTYEGYGPGGAAIIVQCATDNRVRTVSDIRHIFSKAGGNMGEPNSVAWMFERKSQVVIEGDKTNEDQLMEVALEAGADDVQNHGDSWSVLSEPEAHDAVVAALGKANIPTLSAEVGLIPKNTMAIDGKHSAGMMRLLENLEDYDDTQNVYTNYEPDESAIAAMS
ncbi:MAG: YebC/PmpR family DNA-binding transcriptional regulator [Acidobacteria bacterium]|nr:YebC/PmpR family DNA-binding transcriptional regulator [Acidobacteriota bacterium]